MASGLPVVGADAGGLRDLLRTAEWAATFAPGDPEKFSAAVRQILSDDRHTLGLKARKAAVESFGWDRTFQQQVALYRRLANGRSD